MVLDGAIDPALPTVAYATDQADSLESELQSFFAWCDLRRRLPVAPGRRSHRRTARPHPGQPDPATARGRGTGGRTGASCTTPCWPGSESRSSWPTLAGALAGAASGRRIGGGGHGRPLRGRWLDQRSRRRAGHRLSRPPRRPQPVELPGPGRPAGPVGPVFGPLLAWGLLGCATWPVLPDPDPGAGIGPRGTARSWWWERPATR